MISKLITWDSDRKSAINKMIRALGEYEIQGITTIIPFLKKVLNHPDFRKGNFTTHFINENPELFDGKTKLSKVAAIAAIILQQSEKQKKKVVNNNHVESSKWKLINRQNNLD
jgi:acetyl/propionyl-CoA carboxylase alpha subunit